MDIYIFSTNTYTTIQDDDVDVDVDDRYGDGWKGVEEKEEMEVIC